MEEFADELGRTTASSLIRSFLDSPGAEDTMQACDEVFRIPMYGFTESFNISVSVGMTLEQIGRRRRSILAQSGRKGDLSERERLEWTARWLARDMKRVDLILARLLDPIANDS